MSVAYGISLHTIRPHTTRAALLSMFIPLNTLFVQFLAAWSGLPSEDYGFLSTSSGIQATAVKAVNCDGKTFSKDRVESTWTNAKGYAVDHCSEFYSFVHPLFRADFGIEYLTKKYPHKLHNPAGLTLTACAGKGPDGKNREINEVGAF